MIETEEILKDPTVVILFFWWCRQCGWWSQVDVGGLCENCRDESDKKGHGATPDDVERLRQCARCRR